ncbi:MAG: ferrous iron transport protein A [Candidatus Korarchaeota archaeon]|nr:ferrous iron transport protein A [Candidatus Korarchaeota archaeon]
MEAKTRRIGFVPGQVFEVVFNNRGYIVVEIRGSRFGISPGIARKIFIEGVNSEIRA